MPYEEEQEDSSGPESIQTHEQPRSLTEQSQNTENGSLSFRPLLSTEQRGSILAGTLEELDTGWVTVEGKEGKKRYKLSSEEIDNRKVSRSVWIIGSSVLLRSSNGF
jgi:hypothetical protein